METFVVKMRAGKETKNKRVFEAEVTTGEPPKLESIYLPKWVSNGTTRLKITVEEDK